MAGALWLKRQDEYKPQLIPRVARSSQPWALGRNPFRIKRDQRAIRWFMDPKTRPNPCSDTNFPEEPLLWSKSQSADVETAFSVLERNLDVLDKGAGQISFPSNRITVCSRARQKDGCLVAGGERSENPRTPLGTRARHRSLQDGLGAY